MNSGGGLNENPPLAVKVKTMKKLILMVFSLAGLLALMPLFSSGEEVHVKAQNYKIGVGDLLQIEVYDEADLTKEVRVLTDENISAKGFG